MVEQKNENAKRAGRATHTSLTRGLRILETLASQQDEPATLSDTARKVELPRSTTYHIMQTLTHLGYLSQDSENKSYRLGKKVLELCGRGLSTSRIAELALPVLKEICLETGESVALAALFDTHIALIAKHDADGPVRVVQDVGAHRPVHGTALGKVLVAWLPEKERLELLSDLEFEKYTSKTITQRERFETELDQVRSAGVAYDNEEFLQGVRCVAAPILNGGGEVVAALGITGPRQRLQQRKMREFAPLVQGYAKTLSERISNIG